MLGAGEEGFALLAERVKELVNLDPANAVQINAWAWVPFADVVRVVDMVRATGGGEILFVGAPPPSK
jgi:biopolymer transport protein ExbD